MGNQCSNLTIHAGLVENLSLPLYALINNGKMKESNSKIAVLDDVEEDTFIGFSEYAYRGTYTTPERRDQGKVNYMNGAGAEAQNNKWGNIATNDELDTDSSQPYARDETLPEPESEPLAPDTAQDGFDTWGIRNKRGRKKKIA